MIIHVLPGDAQVEEFKKTGIGGEIVVCREALIDGDVRADSLEEFWRVRSSYLSEAYPIEPGHSYEKTVVAEFEKLIDLTASTEVNLWFEYELFCHVNMWFCVWLLRDTLASLYRVAPIMQRKDERWNGFGNLDFNDLQTCYGERIEFTARDIKLGADLWTAYQYRDHKTLRELAKTESACFPYLKEAVEAEVEKDYRPRQVLKEIRESGISDFGETFAEFRKQAGVYGFGDLQVKRILADQVNS
jgi:hypothetical protein